MKKLLFLLTVGLLASTLSVSARPGPPGVDIGQEESLIKQMVTDQTPVVLTAHEVTFIPEVMELTAFDCVTTKTKPEPMAKSVCQVAPELSGVDEVWVTWHNRQPYTFYAIPDLGFHYSEGRAMEYRC